MIKNNHPTLEEIMDFASLSGDSFDINDAEKYFDMVMHFVSCKECADLKDDMVRFNERLESMLSSGSKNRALKLKIYCALDSLEAADVWKNKDVFAAASVKGLLAGKQENVVRFDSQKIKMIQHENDDIEKLLANEPECGQFKASGDAIGVYLADDGVDEHSVLIIPENKSEKPMIQAMEKNGKTWTMQCQCPADDFELVIF